MKIIEKMTNDKTFVSLEFFPPKNRDEWPAFFNAVERLSCINPLFASVTYGAGGSANAESLEIVTKIQNNYAIETMAHLTCIGSDASAVSAFLDSLCNANVSNVLALRGDLPEGDNIEYNSTLHYASDLVSHINDRFSTVGVAVAGYPEVHPEAVSQESDLFFLKKKLDAGADFVVTQLFFDNNLYFDYLTKVRAVGISQPIIPGILPIVSLKVIKRIISLCGATIPGDLLAELEEADQSGGATAVQKVGIAHARKQIAGLLNAGVPGIHIYTLNRAEVVLDIVSGML